MSVRQICGYDIKDCQKVMLEIAVEIDRICKKYDIKYVLDAGSALGAVRHGGFIPWDDDLDIAMLREDYDKFLTVCEREFDGMFFFQNNFTDPEYQYDFAKVRKNGTIFEESVQKNYNIHKGVFVDVFPIDNVKVNSYKFQYRLFQFVRGVRWRKVRFLDGINFKKRIVRTAAWALSILSVYRLNLLLEKVMRWHNKKATEYVYKICNPGELKPLQRREFYIERIRIDFDEHRLYISKDYDAFLRERFGDYMKLPPKNQQKPTHDIISCYLGDEFA